MSSGYVIPVDPAELANRFAAPDAMFDDEVVEDSDDEMVAVFTGDTYESTIVPLLERIPEKEADLIYLYYVCKKRQADIAELFSCTQAAISYRLDRGIQRIKFLLSIPKITEDELRQDLADLFEPIDINILAGMWMTTCQSEVATRLNLTQGRVRHRFFKAVERLKVAAADTKKYEPYEKIFSAISAKGFNILHCVVLPQWKDKGMDRLL